MDREILFRGRRLDNGEWVEGFYMEVQHLVDKSHVHTFVLQKDKCLEIGGLPDFMVEVDPTTVGQYTGLTDKNGMKIFEGDIVFISEWEEIMDVYWRLGVWLLRFRDSDEFLSETAESCEVIGNIHNNPELIGGEDDG